MNKKAGLFATVALGLALSTTANAALIDRGNGLIYDSTQDITWMADANYAKTSGYDTDGLMTWDNATTWADGLSYGGYDDWRLFGVDETCGGYGCSSSGNELGHLFYEDLGLSAGDSILDSTEPELEFFTNVQSNNYWSGTEYAPDTNNALTFTTYGGYQGGTNKNYEFYAWAVRSGDVAATEVPEPGTLLLLAAGLAGIAGARRRRC